MLRLAHPQPATSTWQLAALTVLRVCIGWHLLYEGLVKLLAPSWSAGPYLAHSTWIFSDFFKLLAASPASLAAVDALNVCGLILAGTGLLLGFLARPSAVVGMTLLALYYLSHPPFPSQTSQLHHDQGSCFVNATLIELCALWVVAALPTSHRIGIDRLFHRLLERHAAAGPGETHK